MQSGTIAGTARRGTGRWLFVFSIPALAWVGIWALGAWAKPVVAEEPSPERVVGGPYAVNVGPRSATIMWIVERGQASVGLAPDKMSQAVPLLRAEKILLTGLKPGTQYFYQSFAGEAGKGSFRTAPVGPS